MQNYKKDIGSSNTYNNYINNNTNNINRDYNYNYNYKYYNSNNDNNNSKCSNKDSNNSGGNPKKNFERQDRDSNQMRDILIIIHYIKINQTIIEMIKILEMKE